MARNGSHVGPGGGGPQRPVQRKASRERVAQGLGEKGEGRTPRLGESAREPSAKSRGARRGLGRRRADWQRTRPGL